MSIKNNSVNQTDINKASNQNSDTQNKIDSMTADSLTISSNNYVLENHPYDLTYTSSTTGVFYDYLIYINSTLNMTTTSTTPVIQGLPAGVYNLTVVLNTSIGYTPVYMDLYVIGIKFSSPINESTVNGGGLLANFSYVDNVPGNPVNFQSFSVNVNNSVVIGPYSFSTSLGSTSLGGIFIPLFNNGTNILTFSFNFGSPGTLTYTLSINSINVIPALDVSVGDYWTYSINSFNPSNFYSNNFYGTHSILNLSVVDKISPLLVNLSVDYTNYGLLNNTFLSEQTGWIEVNTINGFIKNAGGTTAPTFSGMESLWLIFSGLQHKYTTTTIFNTFNVPIGNGKNTTFNGINAWDLFFLNPISGAISGNIQFMQSNGVLIHYSLFIEDILFNDLELIKSTYLPITESLNYNQLTFHQGSPSELLSWNVSGSQSGNYKIFLNNSVVQSGSWVPGTITAYNITSLTQGFYNITAVFYNSYGMTATYVTFVQVLAASPPNVKTTTKTTVTTVTNTVPKTTTETITKTTSNTSTSNSKKSNATPGFTIFIVLLGIMFIIRKRPIRK